jgi:hypothetical protein
MVTIVEGLTGIAGQGGRSAGAVEAVGVASCAPTDNGILGAVDARISVIAINGHIRIDCTHFISRIDPSLPDTICHRRRLENANA